MVSLLSSRASSNCKEVISTNEATQVNGAIFPITVFFLGGDEFLAQSVATAEIMQFNKKLTLSLFILSVGT